MKKVLVFLIFVLAMSTLYAGKLGGSIGGTLMYDTKTSNLKYGVYLDTVNTVGKDGSFAQLAYGTRADLGISDISVSEFDISSVSAFGVDLQISKMLSYYILVGLSGYMLCYDDSTDFGFGVGAMTGLVYTIKSSGLAFMLSSTIIYPLIIIPPDESRAFLVTGSFGIGVSF